MKCRIIHESGGRMRVHMNCVRMTLRQADVLEFYLRNIPGVTDVAVFDRTQDAVIRYRENRRTAESVAQAVGVDRVFAEVLPEDKAEFIRKARAEGHVVIMVGDGVNDSPALSEADVGIAISTGAAIAREIADITVASEDLRALVTLRQLSCQLMSRIHRNYRFIIGFNCALIVLGVAGILPPTTSALLHNMSTLGISLKSMTNLLPEGEEK